MTDSTADKNASEGAFEAGPSADELFGEIEESFEGELTDRESDDEQPADEQTGGEHIEDQTAADVFNQLQTDVGNDADGVLSEESPEDIIRSADEPDQESTIDDALLVDESALETLLLTGRTKDKEFLWVDSPDDTDESNSDTSAKSNPSEASAQSVEASVGPEPSDDSETVAESEPSTDADDRSAGTGGDETALVLQDEEQSLTTSEDEQQSSSGFFGWLRSKLGGLF